MYFHCNLALKFPTNITLGPKKTLTFVPNYVFQRHFIVLKEVSVKLLTTNFPCVFGSLKPQSCEFLPLCTSKGVNNFKKKFKDFQP